eukprot:scaffold6706_cov83-Phaeocystis_antarctica.AAC.1
MPARRGYETWRGRVESETKVCSVKTLGTHVCTQYVTTCHASTQISPGPRAQGAGPGAGRARIPAARAAPKPKPKAKAVSQCARGRR